jgi:hypothetical protein
LCSWLKDKGGKIILDGGGMHDDKVEATSLTPDDDDEVDLTYA